MFRNFTYTNSGLSKSSDFHRNSEDIGSAPPSNNSDSSEVTTVKSDLSPHCKDWGGTSPFSPRTPKAPGKLTKYQSFICSDRFTKNGSWTWEIFGLAVGVMSIAAIVSVLAGFDGHGLPDWPYSITLNTLVAFLVSIADPALALPLASGLGQLKWVRFKQKHLRLADLELFDEASRGSWGAANLLTTGRGGKLGSFGAIVTLLALVLGPFVQQVVTYRTRPAVFSNDATIPAALNFTFALPGKSSSDAFVPILPLKAAVYNGLFSESDPSVSLGASCKTGNCTWEPFMSLAVCSQCVDMTPYMTRYCEYGNIGGNFSTCGWQLPNGARLNSSQDAFSMTSQMPDPNGDQPYADIMKLIFMGTEAQDGPSLNYNPWAKQCTLQYCIQSFNTSISNGKLLENISIITNNTVINAANSPTQVTLQAIDNTSYVVSEIAALGTESWFSSLFATGRATRDPTVDSNPSNGAVVVNLTVGISKGTTYFDSDIIQTFYWDYYEYPDGLDKAMSDLATSMTVAFRSFGNTRLVNGTEWSVESYVHVRWGWISLPLLVLVLTAMFLVAVMLENQRYGTQLWKSSAIALLFHGLDSETKNQFDVENFNGIKKAARDVKVQLGAGDDGEILLRM